MFHLGTQLLLVLASRLRSSCLHDQRSGPIILFRAFALTPVPPAIPGKILYILRLGFLQPLYYGLGLPVKSWEADSRLLCSLRRVCSVGPVCACLSPSF